MNGEDIPELAPIPSRRKRRKGFPTRVTKTVVLDESSSDSDSIPPFLLPNSPARIAPSGGSDGTSSRNMSPPLQTGSTPPRSVTPINRSSPAQATARGTARSNSTDNSDVARPASPIPGENGVISGALFGFSKLTSSITSTSQGTKRVKLVIYMCNFCSYKTSDNSAFWEHCMNHLFTCMHCPFKAFTRQHFVKHLEKEHPGQMPDEYVNIRDISMLDMSISGGSSSSKTPLAKAASSGASGKGEALPAKLASSGKSKVSQSSSKQPTPVLPQTKQTLLKFRCETCAYTTTIFQDFVEHQKLHKPGTSSNTTSSPVSGKLKSLLTSPAALDSYSQKQVKLPSLKNSMQQAKVEDDYGDKSLKESPKTSVKESPVLKFKDTAKHARCPICNFLLQSLPDLEAHIQRCHQSRLTVTGSTTMEGTNNDSEGYTWGCVYCGSKSETKLSVVAHIKTAHSGEKIRVWRWPNKANNAQSATETSSQQQVSARREEPETVEGEVKKRSLKRKDKHLRSKSSKRKVLCKAESEEFKLEKSDSAEQGENAEENAASLLLKQIVSSTIDDVYSSSHPEGQPTPVLSGKKTLVKIPEGSSAKDIMSGKCAITVRKVSSVSPNVTTSPRAMRSLITGGLVTSPGGVKRKTVSPHSQSVFTNSGQKTSSLNKSKSEENAQNIPDLNLQPPLLTPSFLDMSAGNLDSDIFPASDIKQERSPSPEPAGVKNEPEDDSLQEGINDVDVEVRKESLRPSDYIKYNEELRVHCCRYCVYQTKSYGHIIDHISTHTGMKTWSCSYCSYKSNRRHDLLRHLQKKHAGFKLKMIRNVPYSNKFNYPLKMSQRVSAARSMVAKKKLSYPTARKSTTRIPSHKLLKKNLHGKKNSVPSGGALAPVAKIKSPVKVAKWQPPPTVEFWECPICFRRSSMDVLENHIPYVHPDRVRKRISKKEVLAPTEFSQVRSAKAQGKRTLKVHLAPAETLVGCNHLPVRDQQLVHGVDRKLQLVPDIMARYKLREKEEDRLEEELDGQRRQEAEEERKWLSTLETELSDDDSFQNILVPEEEYQCQYCTHTDKSLYSMRKHLIWNHPNMLLKCIDLRARKKSLTPRVIHMCYRCVFYSVSPNKLLSHYSKNKGHGPESDSESESPAEDELPVLEPACTDLSRTRGGGRDNDDSLPALEKNEDVEKKVQGKFLTRPLTKPTRQVARKRVTMSQKVAVVVNKNAMKFVEGIHLRCKYCKEFKLTDSAIMKNHLLTEHTGQPAIAIDIRSQELKRTSRLFFCPILECDFVEYGPKPIVAHLREVHSETNFESLIMQICPKDARVNSVSSKEPDTPKSSPKVTQLKESENPKQSPKIYAPVKEDTPKQSPRVTPEEEAGDTQIVGIEENGVVMGGKIPKTNAELQAHNRYWCIVCDAHASSISKFKGHFLEKHIDCRPQVVDARARIFRKKSRIYFCWNATCEFTTFQLKDAELHEESKMCLTNYVDDFKDEDEQLSGISSPGSKSPDASASEHQSRSASQMYQCLYCSWMTSSHVNMLSHMAAEHACTSGGYSEINTDFDQNGAVVMNVGGAPSKLEDRDNNEGANSSDLADSDE